MSFEDQATADGVYDTCFSTFSEPFESLSQLDIGEDFIYKTEEWPPNRFSTRFCRPDDSTDITVTLFGEVLGEADGTGLGARGGSSVKRSDVGDNFKIRDSIALGPPTNAKKPLIDLFNDQITTLVQVTKQVPLPGREGITKRIQWTKSKRAGEDPTQICLVLPYKYTDKQETRVKLQKRSSDMDVGDASKKKITLETTYAPEEMSDFDSDLRLPGGRLVQQAILDEAEELLQPWQVPLAVRKGTLVAVEAQLHIYHFLDGNYPSHLYQLLGSAVKILALSPLPYTKQEQPRPKKKLRPVRSMMFKNVGPLEGAPTASTSPSSSQGSV